ncbi:MULTISPECIES: hypothetical protein [unclassified Clostridium]|uniref:hypothetical protein n=2 Tax=Clostridium TaxID=1485 RepID=UPI0025C13BC1|nr:hypothetical protein [Clostridium sp.]MCI6692675.1 hypothetical protein [Clostridium sp.]
MYYNKIYNFIESLSSSNIEECKPQLKKYMIELILSVKDYDNNIDLKELESMLNTILIKEELQSEIENELKESKFKFGLLTDEFMNIYDDFINTYIENGYLENAISLTRSIIKGIGCTYRDIYLVKKNGGFTEENYKYINSIEFLNDLKEELRKHLKQDINNIHKEYFNIRGLVEYIKNELEENINDIGAILMSELKSKSLDEFHKEEHICEYKSIFTQEYIRELRRRKYEWAVLSSKLKENYYRDMFYEDID